MINITYSRYYRAAVFKLIKLLVVLAFVTNLVLPPYAQAQNVIGVSAVQTLNLPVPGALINPTFSYNPPIIKGLKLYPDNPLRFDFMMDTGDDPLEGPALEAESSKLIKYFLAALTTPEDEMWVNLSPYEKDRIIPTGFGRTEMGRDLLAQDYLLKQLTASLMYPEEELGKEFWKRVYAKAEAKYGITDIPVNTFNKVWIVPDKAVVYTHERNAFVVETHLKVMLEEEYLKSEQRTVYSEQSEKSQFAVHSPQFTQVLKEILIPEIEREVNEGKTFANLRQIYYAVILASWYKQNLKESLLGHLYVNQNKTEGVDTGDPEVNQKIYQQYLEAFKKGVVDLIKEDYDPATQQVVQRKYFSGGAVLGRTQNILSETTVLGEEIFRAGRGKLVSMSVRGTQSGEFDPLAALVARNNGERKPLEVSPVTGKAEIQEEDLKKFSERGRTIIDKFNKLQGVIKVVDMGSGRGTFSEKYRERFPNHAIIGYEIDKLMFEAGDWQVLGDAGHTGLLSESVDKVTINMPHPKDVETVIPHLIKEARRILKPGGEIYIVFEAPNNKKPSLVPLVKSGEGIILITLEKLGFIVEYAGEPLDPDYPRTAMMERYEQRFAGINLFKAKRPSTDEENATNTAKPDSAQSATANKAQETQRWKDHLTFLSWAREKVYGRFKRYVDSEDYMTLNYERQFGQSVYLVKDALAVDPNGKLYIHFHGGFDEFEFGISRLPSLREAEGRSVEEVAEMIAIENRDVFISMLSISAYPFMLRLMDIRPDDKQLPKAILQIIKETKLIIARDLKMVREALNKPPSNVFQDQEGVFKLSQAKDVGKQSKIPISSTNEMKARDSKIVFPAVQKIPGFALAQNADSAQNATALENGKDVGGIDLNPQMINLETQGESSGFQSTFNPRDLEGIHINGLFPVIINITPISNVPQLMGIKSEPGEDKIAHSHEISKSQKSQNKQLQKKISLAILARKFE